MYRYLDVVRTFLTDCIRDHPDPDTFARALVAATPDLTNPITLYKCGGPRMSSTPSVFLATACKSSIERRYLASAEKS